jgi:hypothetical protein
MNAVETIDMTPNWEQSVYMLLVILENGDDKGKAMARNELLRLGRAMDQAIASLK